MIVDHANRTPRRELEISDDAFGELASVGWRRSTVKKTAGMIVLTGAPCGQIRGIAMAVPPFVQPGLNGGQEVVANPVWNEQIGEFVISRITGERAVEQDEISIEIDTFFRATAKPYISP